MRYTLVFWRAAAPRRTDGSAPTDTSDWTDAQIGTALLNGDWRCVQADESVLEFRRDLIASDPDWPNLRFVPGPGSAQPQDRYLAVVFAQPPAEEQVRDLRYVAARNRLSMFGPRATPVGDASDTD